MPTNETAVAVAYDPVEDQIVVTTSTGRSVSVARSKLQGLDRAGAKDLARIVISPAGLGLHFPVLDADIYVPALLEGVYGSPQWMRGLKEMEG